MRWAIEYYELPTGEQPAEVFEERLPVKLRARLVRFAEATAASCGKIGGGYWEPCRHWPGLFEVRAGVARDLGRYYAAVDGNRMVLLGGFQKREGEPTPQTVFEEAERCRQDYYQTHRVSPERPVQEGENQ